MRERIVIFTGSRELPKEYHAEVERIVRRELHDHSLIFVGDCPSGLDALVYNTAFRDNAGHLVAQFKAPWSSEGRRAGPLRNTRMVDTAVVMAQAMRRQLVCHAWPMPGGLGTLDCMARARSYGIPVTDHGVHHA